jgi:hypothetical protein
VLAAADEAANGDFGGVGGADFGGDTLSKGLLAAAAAAKLLLSPAEEEEEELVGASFPALFVV